MLNLVCRLDTQGRTRVGPIPRPPPLECPPWGGGHSWGGALLILHLLAYCIALTQTKRLRKEIKYMLIHNTLQRFIWSSIALNIHVSHFENWIFLFVVSLQKWLAHFLLQKRWRNEGFKGTSDLPLYNGRSLEITHVFHLSIIFIV